MALTKTQKTKVIKELKENIDKQKSVIFVDFANLKSKNFFDLRKKLRKEDCALKVAKKTLLKVALKGHKIPIWGAIKDNIPGQLALIFEFDEKNEASKIVYGFSRENTNLKILGGLFKNNYKTSEEVVTLAKLPSRQIILGQLVGAISSPIANFVYVLKGNVKGLVCALSAIKK